MSGLSQYEPYHTFRGVELTCQYKEAFSAACDVIQELAEKYKSRQTNLDDAHKKINSQAKTLCEQKAIIDAAHVSYVAMKREYETRQSQADSLVGLANCRAMTASARGHALAKQLTKEKELHAFDNRLRDSYSESLNTACQEKERLKIALHNVKAALNEIDTQQASRTTSVRQVPSVSDTRDTDWYPC